MSSDLWVVGLGAGAGEATFARAFIGAAEEAGIQVRAIGEPESSRRVLGPASGLMPPPHAFAEQVRRERPVAVVFATSGTCAAWIEALPASVRAFSLEFTWAMWAGLRPSAISPLLRMYTFLPQDVFEAGLRRGGGPFEVTAEAAARICCVGWAESAPEVELLDETVVIYLGQPVNGETFQWGPGLAGAIEAMAAERPSCGWVYVGSRRVDLPACVERIPWLDRTEFRRLVAGSSALICHHGMGTITTAIAAGTPVLALCDGLSWRSGALPEWSDQEIFTFDKAGLVRAAYGRSPAAAIARRLAACLAARHVAAPDANGARRALQDMLRFVPC